MMSSMHHQHLENDIFSAAQILDTNPAKKKEQHLKLVILAR